MSEPKSFNDPGVIKSALGRIYDDVAKTIDSYLGNEHFHSSIHGAEHSKRVLLFALLIADQMGLSDTDKEVLATATTFHDTQRYDDWLDTGHGARAADAYLSTLTSASKQDLLVASIIRYHDLDDSIGEHDIGMEFGDHGVLLFRIFKDADGLDRFRLGEDALKDRFLRTNEAKELIGLSRAMNRAAKVLDDDRKALVIVDVQNDFITGSLANPDAESKTPNILARAFTFDGIVLITRDTHDEDYLGSQEGRNLPVEHCIRGSEGWDLPTPLGKMADEKGWTIYEKPTFGSVQLAQDLADMHAEGMIDSVELIGFCTDICVVSNALLVKAFAPELKVIVDSSLCSGTTKDAHDAALETMRSCQIEIKD